MIWGRVVRLEARNAEGVQVDVSALRIDARCVRSRVFDDNELEATIHGANDDTIAKFLKRGTNVALYAGYEQGAEPGLIYQGNIIDSKTYRSGTEILTVIRSIALRSLKRPFTCTPVCLTFKPGSNAGQVVKSIANILGLVPIGVEMAEEVQLPSGWTFVGPVSQAMKRLAQDMRTKGVGLYVDLAEMVVFRYSSDSTYSIAYISPESGLLNLQDTTDYVEAARSNLSSIISKFAKQEAEKEKAKKEAEKEAEAREKAKKKGKKYEPKKKSRPKTTEVILKPEDYDDAYAVLDDIFTNMKKTYSARTMVMPKVTPNSLVHIADKGMGVDGLFVVDRMEIAVGNGPDSSFSMDLNLIEA